MALIHLWIGAPASCAAPQIENVQIHLSGKTLPLKSPAVTDGQEVYLPLEALRSLGLTYRLTAHEDTAFAVQKSQPQFELPIARPGGRPMVPLSTLAEHLSLTTRLEGRLCCIYRAGEKVPSVRVAKQAVSGPLQTSRSKPAGKPNVASLSSVSAPVRSAETPVKSTTQAPRSTTPPKPDGRSASVQATENIDRTETGASPKSDSLKPIVPETSGQTPPSTDRARSIVPQKGSASVRILDVEFEATDSAHCRVFVRTEGAAKAATRMLSDPTRLDLIIPGSALHTGRTTWAVDHPFLSHIHAQPTADGTGTEVTLSLKRLIAYTLTSSAQGLRLNLALPRGSERKMSQIAVVIDPGHGGKATGCSSAGPAGRIYEKNLTLAIAKLAADELRSQGVRVILTREDDTDVSLSARPAVATEHNADLFVSIHIDDCRIPDSASGPTAYYHMNDADSRCLAHSLITRIASAIGLPNRGALSDRCLYVSGLAVLRHSTVPATLVEVGYLNNSRDRKKLIDPEVQHKVARAICEGIQGYIEGDVAEQAMLITPIQATELP